MVATIQFKFNPQKTVEVAAMFLKLHGGTMKFLGLLKLLYLADRVALKRIDQPLSGDNYVSMDFGPVLSITYDLIKGQCKSMPEAIDIWRKHISIRDEFPGHVVKLLADPGVDELSREEEEIIRDVYKKCGNYDRFELAELTHKHLPEWKNPHGSSIAIDIVDILKNVGKSEKEIEYIREIAETEAYLNLILDD